MVNILMDRINRSEKDRLTKVGKILVKEDNILSQGLKPLTIQHST
jgi:hypothetical protein